MIGTSDGEQFSDSFEYTLDTLRKVSKGILPDAFHEAVESMPTSTNVEDRREEPKRKTGEGGKL